ncbi:hypothetical protein V6N13_009354 [Hibiscus sabdariffa]|uniref:Uncharacterized protein n=1 Tax=Hibiscus sabdariffa TaxID=183260 RepID=A0ABR2PNQ7_9ROSI
MHAFKPICRNCRTSPPQGAWCTPVACSGHQLHAKQGSGAEPRVPASYRTSTSRGGVVNPINIIEPCILQMALLPRSHQLISSSQLPMCEGLVPQTKPSRGGEVPLVL